MKRSLMLVTTSALLAFAGCGDTAPRFGAVPITAEAPSATLSGTTNPISAALELAPGCAGYLDPDAPEHIVTVADPGKLGISARSAEGPIALVVSRDDDWLCDSDDNTGHVPHLQITEPGTYAVRVASLASNQPLPYELVIAPDSKETHGAGAENDRISVTVTSEPEGAQVRTSGGQVLGTTPAMFEVDPGRAGDDGDYAFVVEADAFRPITVRGTPTDGELVLHASLRPAGPRQLTVSSNEPQPIRDFSTAEQSVAVEGSCIVSDLEVDVSIRHSYVGDLIVTLHAPSGETATLHRYRGGARSNLERTYRMGDGRAMRDLANVQAQGQWRMTVRDNAEIDTGSFDSFALRFTCAPQTASAATTATPAAANRNRPTGRNYGRAAPQRQMLGVIDPWAP